MDDYQHHILLKPVYLCSVILDPRSKTKEIDGGTLSAVQKTPAELRAFFLKAAEAFNTYGDIDPQAVKEEETAEASGEESDGPRRSRKRRKICDLASEIEAYLTSEVEDPQQTVHDYWRRKKDVHPTLEAMARSFLAVAATSAPSSRIFASGDGVLNELRMSMLKPDNWEPLAYLKSWSESGLI